MIEYIENIFPVQLSTQSFHVCYEQILLFYAGKCILWPPLWLHIHPSSVISSSHVALNIIFLQMFPKCMSLSLTFSLSSRPVYVCSCLLNIFTWRSNMHFKFHMSREESFNLCPHPCQFLPSSVNYRHPHLLNCSNQNC